MRLLGPILGATALLIFAGVSVAAADNSSDAWQRVDRWNGQILGLETRSADGAALLLWCTSDSLYWLMVMPWVDGVDEEAQVLLSVDELDVSLQNALASPGDGRILVGPAVSSERELDVKAIRNAKRFVDVQVIRRKRVHARYQFRETMPEPLAETFWADCAKQRD